MLDITTPAVIRSRVQGEITTEDYNSRLFQTCNADGSEELRPIVDGSRERDTFAREQPYVASFVHLAFIFAEVTGTLPRKLFSFITLRMLQGESILKKLYLDRKIHK